MLLVGSRQAKKIHETLVTHHQSTSLKALSYGPQKRSTAKIATKTTRSTLESAINSVMLMAAILSRAQSAALSAIAVP